MSEIEPHFVLTNCNINIVTGMRKRSERVREIKDCEIKISGIVLQNSQSEQLLIKNIESKFSIQEGVKLMDYIYEKMAFSFTNLSMTADLDSLFINKNYNKVACDGCKVSLIRVNNISYNNIPLLKIVKDKDMRMWIARSKKISEILNSYDNKVNLMLPEKFLQNHWEKIIDSQITNVQKLNISNTKATSTLPVINKPKKQKYDQILEFMEELSNEKTEETYKTKEQITRNPADSSTKLIIDNEKEIVCDKFNGIEIRVDDSSTIEKSPPMEKTTNNTIKEFKGNNLLDRLRRIKEEQSSKSHSTILESNETDKEEKEIIKKKELTKTQDKESTLKTGVDKTKKKVLSKKKQSKLIKNNETGEETNNLKTKNNKNMEIKGDKMYITNRNKYRRLPEKDFNEEVINNKRSEIDENRAHTLQNNKLETIIQNTIMKHKTLNTVIIEKLDKNIIDSLSDNTGPQISLESRNKAVSTNEESQIDSIKTPVEEIINPSPKEVTNNDCIINPSKEPINNTKEAKTNLLKNIIHSDENLNIRNKTIPLKITKKQKKRKSYF